MHVKSRIRKLPSYQKGGVVKETGPALVHEGETIIPSGRAASAMGGAAPESKTAMGSLRDQMAPEVDAVIIRKADNGFIIEHELGGEGGKKGKRPKQFLVTDPMQLHSHIDEAFGIEPEGEEVIEEEIMEPEAGVEEEIPEEEPIPGEAEESLAADLEAAPEEEVPEEEVV